MKVSTITPEDIANYIRLQELDEADKKLINNLKKVVSSREAMQNAYSEMLKQKKRR